MVHAVLGKRPFAFLILLLIAMMNLGASNLVASDLGAITYSRTSSYSGTPQVSLSSLNFLDRCAVFQYDDALDKASTITTMGLLATPAIYALTKGNDTLKTELLYIGTIGLTYGVKELVKTLVPRERPYLYSEGYPTEELENGDYCRSFPSGHTALAFASATFLTSMLYLDKNSSKDNSLRVPIVATSYAIATTVAVLRVLSGNHYITDVLAGALIGAACGIAVPLVYNHFSKDLSVGLSALGISSLGISLNLSL